jgi:hypothetical protein
MRRLLAPLWGVCLLGVPLMWGVGSLCDSIGWPAAAVFNGVGNLLAYLLVPAGLSQIPRKEAPHVANSG